MFKFNLNFLKKISFPKKMDILKKMNRNNVLIGLAVIAIIITAGLIYANSNKGFSLASIFGKSKDQVGQEAVDYINNNQLSQTPATLVSASEESGIIKIKIKIGENEFDSYVTKDGRFLFPQTIEMKPEEKKAEPEVKDDPANASLQKSDNAVLDAFVVSDCPYGLQMQRAIADAVKNAPELASNVVVRYIGSISDGKAYSMHDAGLNGEEAKENLRQICLREEQPTKYWDYVSCYMKKATGKLENGMPIGDTTGCLATTGVEIAKLNSCVAESNRGLAYAKVDFDLSSKYNVSGSPTLILNGTEVSASRSSDGVKKALCSGFNSEPGYCGTQLNTASAAASFSTTYSSASGSANDASCN